MVTRWSWTSLRLYLLDPTLSHIQNGWQLNITWLVVVCLQNHSITNSLHVFKHVELVNAQSEVRQLFAETWCMIIRKNHELHKFYLFTEYSQNHMQNCSPPQYKYSILVVLMVWTIGLARFKCRTQTRAIKDNLLIHSHSRSDGVTMTQQPGNFTYNINNHCLRPQGCYHTVSSCATHWTQGLCPSSLI